MTAPVIVLALLVATGVALRVVLLIANRVGEVEEYSLNSDGALVNVTRRIDAIAWDTLSSPAESRGRSEVAA